MSFLGAQNSIALGVQGLIHIDTGGGAGGSADYLLAKSLRFRSSASAYLNRTFGTPTNNLKWTWSAWVKRGKLGSAGVMFQGYASLATRTAIQFNSSDQLVFNGTVATATTTAVFRDPAAWYHIVCVYDSANATAANRLLLYVNGTVQTVTGTQPTASQVEFINGAWLHYISTGYSGAFEYLDESLAEVNFVDGQALAPTAFGAYSTYNQWLPIAYAGTYGTNGFYLPFTNTASTSTLVADSSGNANNWTPNNISLTAGSTYDSLTDVPTLTSETVANYAVLNPLQIGGVTTSPTPITLSNGNLYWYYNRTTSGSGWLQATIAIPSTGKWYYEYVSDSGSPVAYSEPGIMDIATPKSQATPSQYRAYYGYDGTKISNGVYSAYGAAAVLNDILSVAIDMDNGALYFGKNGTWLNSGVPTSGASKTGAAFTDLISAGVTWVPMMGIMGNSVATGYVNFGQQPFTYTAPSGFLPLNTFNIPAGTVTTSGTFTGNLSTDGPFVFLNGTPTAMTINGNAVTFGTHADKLANGFKVRSSSVLYNLIGSNTYVATTVGAVFKYEDAQSNP